MLSEGTVNVYIVLTENFVRLWWWWWYLVQCTATRLITTSCPLFLETSYICIGTDKSDKKTDNYNANYIDISVYTCSICIRYSWNILLVHIYAMVGSHILGYEWKTLLNSYLGSTNCVLVSGTTSRVETPSLPTYSQPCCMIPSSVHNSGSEQSALRVTVVWSCFPLSASYSTKAQAQIWTWKDLRIMTEKLQWEKM